MSKGRWQDVRIMSDCNPSKNETVASDTANATLHLLPAALGQPRSGAENRAGVKRLPRKKYFPVTFGHIWSHLVRGQHLRNQERVQIRSGRGNRAGCASADGPRRQPCQVWTLPDSLHA